MMLFDYYQVCYNILSISRKHASTARWNDQMGMAEVLENKGSLWTTTGIVRCGKIYCSIEETL